MRKTTYVFKKTTILFLLSAFCCAAWQCQSQKKISDGDCTEKGVVKDFSGLDGCRLLIETENGEKLLPALIDDASFELQAGQEILFSYKEAPDQMSICMAEDKIVRISCIRLAGENRPAVPACLKLEKMEKANWLAALQNKHQPEKIIRYPYKTDGWAYLFTGKEFYLYDCQGSLVRTSASAAACLKGEVTAEEAGKVIYHKAEH